MTGTYNIQLKGLSSLYPSAMIASVSFKINVKCIVQSLTSSGDMSRVIYYVNSPKIISYIPTLTQTPYCGYSYSFTLT